MTSSLVVPEESPALELGHRRFVIQKASSQERPRDNEEPSASAKDEITLLLSFRYQIAVADDALDDNSTADSERVAAAADSAAAAAVDTRAERLDKRNDDVVVEKGVSPPIPHPLHTMGRNEVESESESESEKSEQAL